MNESRFLGDYRLIKHIGQGSMGSTFVAEQRFTKKKYVLKVLPEELSQDRAFLQRFEEEIVALSQLEHPNIVKIYNVSFAQGVYFLVCDCVVDDMGETTNLSEFFRQREKKLTQNEVLSIAQAVAGALDYAHGCKIAHRNLKLNNILISARQPLPAPQIQVRISDWGLSKIIGIGACLTRTFKGMAEALGIVSITQNRYPQPAVDAAKLVPIHQTLLQNFAFLAPEQKRLDVTANERVDVYSFGVLIYYLLMGEYPEGSFMMPSQRLDDPIIDWDSVVKECLNPISQARPYLLEELLAKATVAKFATPVQELAPEPVLVAAEPPAPAQTSRSPWVREERVVKEYAPEKRELSTIQPLLSEMATIEGGYYYRGSSTGCRDEMPRHQVMISRFAIDIHPVTNEQFMRYLEYVGGEKDNQNHDIIRLRESRIKRSAGRFSIEPGYNKHPVVGVTWYGAVGYAQWVGKRLPTEAEWEVAYSGNLENPLYPTGETIEKTEANFFSSDTTAVMSYPPNAYGIYDMAGNVYEWCQDWYEYNFYESSAQEPDNPKGPLQGVYRVLRGGCWKSLQEDLRTSKRHRNNPGVANGTYGFRLASDA
ncbi:MAG: SUMF1/EgtB/PvdO family nonheme iron enzyme [Verrucomicrobia bacterium]|nr:SUMF1/EgtB/PvdO family nonheme iron enzyme [Verrucomicrobiota bacterium]MBS0636966.1 SUMF1/EgtB/PvdO family nonheme iron enzyme [Verrucomicrobiota bacterium]